MADVVFVKLEDGRIIKLEGEYCIQELVRRNMMKFGFVKEVGEVYRKICLLEPHPIVRNRLMARLFAVPDCVRNFVSLGRISDEWFVMAIRNLKDNLGYVLFPAAQNLDKQFEESTADGKGAKSASLMMPWSEDVILRFNKVMTQRAKIAIKILSPVIEIIGSYGKPLIEGRVRELPIVHSHLSIQLPPSIPCKREWLCTKESFSLWNLHHHLQSKAWLKDPREPISRPSLALGATTLSHSVQKIFLSSAESPLNNCLLILSSLLIILMGALKVEK
nr:hypothetical protein [Tanacetum cinerariifolium]